MTLTIFDQLEQGTPEWLEARRGIVTASTIGQLITARTLKPAQNETARNLIETLVIEAVTGRVEPIHANAAMERGNRDEPWARHEYEKATGRTVTEVGFIRYDGPDYTLGYSPDGLVGDDGLIEIKSRSPRIQMQTIIADKVPAANMAQIMTGLFVTGREWLDYISYSSGMPLYVKRVYPDQKWFAAIEQTMWQFVGASSSLRTKYAEAAKEHPMTEWIDHDAEQEDIY